MGAGDTEDLSVLYTQLCCEPKATLKNKVYLTQGGGGHCICYVFFKLLLFPYPGKSVLWTECLCPLKIRMLSCLQCDGIWM